MEREGRSWKRRIGTETWTPVDSVPERPTQMPLSLMLVRKWQAAGEPDHWLLFLSEEGKKGSVFQVTGDITYMEHLHEENVDIVNCDEYKDSFILADISLEQADLVRDYAYAETPPQAANQALATENCQGWTIRVMAKLVQKGIVAERWVEEAISLKQPVK